MDRDKRIPVDHGPARLTKLVSSTGSMPDPGSEDIMERDQKRKSSNVGLCLQHILCIYAGSNTNVHTYVCISCTGTYYKYLHKK